MPVSELSLRHAGEVVEASDPRRVERTAGGSGQLRKATVVFGLQLGSSSRAIAVGTVCDRLQPADSSRFRESCARRHPCRVGSLRGACRHGCWSASFKAALSCRTPLSYLGRS